MTKEALQKELNSVKKEIADIELILKTINPSDKKAISAIRTRYEKLVIRVEKLEIATEENIKAKK